MKNVGHITYSRRAIATLALLFGAVACDDRDSLSPIAGPARVDAPLARITVTSDLVTLTKGDMFEITLPGVTDPAALLLWSSDDASIAEVDSRGMIVARGVGSTTVTVSEAGKATDILVTVVPTGSMEATQ